MNLAEWVQRHGRRRPDAPALADGDRVHADWRLFAARTATIAGGLRNELGLAPGDRVAIVMRNRPEYLEALFAIWHAGLVAVPVNARLHRDEIAYILDHSGSTVAVTSSPFSHFTSNSERWSRDSNRTRTSSPESDSSFIEKPALGAALSRSTKP